MFAVLTYALLKFTAYAWVCSRAVPMLRIDEPHPFSFGVAWGFLRLGMGLVVGASIFSLGFSPDFKNGLTALLLIGILLRTVEWTVLWAAMVTVRKLSGVRGAAGWVALGVWASVMIDGLLFWTVGNIKFVC